MKYQIYISTLLLVFIMCSSVLYAQQAPSGVPHVAISQGKEEEKRALATGEFQLDGIASYYGEAFHNRTTANGEVFNMNAFTAAHRTLPFNTVVEVRNTNTGKKVSVRINDRGPYLKNRVIDLSQRAAETLGIIGEGTAPVKIRILHMGRKNIITKHTEDNKILYDIDHNVHIQVASYSQKDNADRLMQTLASNNIPSNIEAYNGMYRVVISDVDNIQINTIIEQLHTLGFNKVLVKTP